MSQYGAAVAGQKSIVGTEEEEEGAAATGNAGTSTGTRRRPTATGSRCPQAARGAPGSARRGHPRFSKCAFTVLSLGCSTLCLVLPGLMGNWQNCLSSWARWWNIPNQSQTNRGSTGDGPPSRLRSYRLLYCSLLFTAAGQPTASSPSPWCRRTLPP